MDFKDIYSKAGIEEKETFLKELKNTSLWKNLMDEEHLKDALEIPEIQKIFINKIQESLSFLSGLPDNLNDVLKGEQHLYDLIVDKLLKSIPYKDIENIPLDLLTTMLEEPKVYKRFAQIYVEDQGLELTNYYIDFLLNKTPFYREVLELDLSLFFKLRFDTRRKLLKDIPNLRKKIQDYLLIRGTPEEIDIIGSGFFESDLEYTNIILKKNPSLHVYKDILLIFNEENLRTVLKDLEIKRTLINFLKEGNYIHIKQNVLYELFLVEPNIINAFKNFLNDSIDEKDFQFYEIHHLVYPKLFEDKNLLRKFIGYITESRFSLIEDMPASCFDIFIKDEEFLNFIFDHFHTIDFSLTDNSVIPQGLYNQLIFIPKFKKKVEESIIEDWDVFKRLPEEFTISSSTIFKALYQDWIIKDQLPNRIKDIIRLNENTHIRKALITNWNNLRFMPFSVRSKFKNLDLDFIKEAAELDINSLQNFPLDDLEAFYSEPYTKDILYKALIEDFSKFYRLPPFYKENLMANDEFVNKFIEIDWLRFFKVIFPEDRSHLLRIVENTLNQNKEKFLQIILKDLKDLLDLEYLPLNYQLSLVENNEVNYLLKEFKDIVDLERLDSLNPEVLALLESKIFDLELHEDHKEGENLFKENLDPTIYELLRKMGEEVSLEELKIWGFLDEKIIKDLMRAYDQKYLREKRGNYVKGLGDLSKKEKSLRLKQFNQELQSKISIPKEFILNFNKSEDPLEVKEIIAENTDRITLRFEDPFIQNEVKNFRKNIKENSKIKHQLWTGMQKLFESKNHVFLWVLPTKLIPPVLKAITIEDATDRDALLEHADSLTDEMLEESGIDTYLKNTTHPNTPGNLTIGWIRYTLAKDLTGDKDDDRIWIDEVQTDFSSFFGKENTGVIYNINDLLYLLMKRFIQYIRGKGFESIYMPSAQMANSLYHRKNKPPKSIYTELPSKLRFKKNIIEDLDDKVDGKPVWKLANKTLSSNLKFVAQRINS